MTPEIQMILDDGRDQMQKAIDHLEAELLKIRAGKANPQMLEGVRVDYYGSIVPISQVGNINTPDSRTLVVQPWEKNMLQPIEKAIQAANLGLNPQNDGNLIRINVPPLTEERRKDLVKQAKNQAEHAKVSIRTVRREANEMIKKEQKSGLPEDMTKAAEDQVQKLTDEYISKADVYLSKKEKEIMTV